MHVRASHVHVYMIRKDDSVAMASTYCHYAAYGFDLLSCMATETLDESDTLMLFFINKAQRRPCLPTGCLVCSCRYIIPRVRVLILNTIEFVYKILYLYIIIILLPHIYLVLNTYTHTHTHTHSTYLSSFV